jgi:hypothetical protein
LTELIRTLKTEADKKLGLPLQNYSGEGELLYVSRDEISRILTLAMAYRLFNDEKYAAKVQEELLNVCGFPSWSPSHFLDDAEMTTAVAIGYDWCYNYLSPETHKIVENAILEKAFAPAWQRYERKGEKPFDSDNNWNMVCNSGMVNGALAIGDKYPGEAERVIGYAVKYTPTLLKTFAPEGVFNEGPGYWSYNGMFMSLFFDNLNRIFKKDFGLTKFVGLDNTARYYMAQVGPSNHTFNYGDASDHMDYSPTFFFLSKRYNQPEVAAYYRNKIKFALDEYKLKGEFTFPRLFFLAIPWFDDSPPAEVMDETLTIFNGVTDLIIINGGKKSDINRLYLAAKTGRATWSHNHLDGGSFVLDCDGERWGIEIGPETYSLPDFWDYKPGGVRWSYFRNTNHAHSTLSIDNKISNSAGEGEIIKVSKEALQPFGIMDLSPYYKEQAASTMRGFKLLSPKTLLVRDEIVLKPDAKEISWRFITRAEVQIKGNTAILSQNGKKIYLRCMLQDGFQLNAFPAVPYSDKERAIKDINIVEITLNKSEKLFSIPVIMSNNLDEFENNSEAGQRLTDWK